MLSRLSSELAVYPLNLFLAAKHVEPSYAVKNLVAEIDAVHGMETSKTDPNTLPTLIDYKLVSPQNPLFKTIQEDLLRTQPPLTTLLLLSFSKEMLGSNTQFINSLRTAPFTVEAALLNLSTYPYLADEISAQTAEMHKPSETCINLQTIAHYGLVNVSKQHNGSLLLVKQPTPSVSP